MKNRWKDILSFLLFALIKFWRIWLITAVIIIVAIWLRNYRNNKSEGTSIANLKIEKNKQINATPEALRRIKDIGQWEFLSIEAEELVEANEMGILSHKQMAKIYTGTLRIGLDFRQLTSDWYSSKGDTAYLHLPRLRLLDTHFIDETRTKDFYTKGSWTAEDREALYKQAQRKMIGRVLTPDNFYRARKNATKSIAQLFSTLGFKQIYIRYE